MTIASILHRSLGVVLHSYGKGLAILNTLSHGRVAVGHACADYVDPPH